MHSQYAASVYSWAVTHGQKVIGMDFNFIRIFMGFYKEIEGTTRTWMCHHPFYSDGLKEMKSTVDVIVPQQTLREWIPTALPTADAAKNKSE